MREMRWHHERAVDILGTIRLLLILDHLVGPVCTVQTWWPWRKSVRAQYCLKTGRVLLEVWAQSSLALLLHLCQLLCSSFTQLQHIILWRSCASHCEQGHDVRLAHHAKLGVATTNITLPVGVVGDVCGWECDGIVVEFGVIGARCWIAELWVERDTGGAFGVNRKQIVNLCVDSGRLDSIFL
jgi:hypothetical protein